jgi:ubiquinone/menaquinone biosynthesis C-methylase UbiE
MKTEWDYTALAETYGKRPDYAHAAIDAMLGIMASRKQSRFCDIGAGAAHLTLLLAKRGMAVTAVEPNDAMRARGIERTEGLTNVRWHEGTGEETGLPSCHFDAVTFGSSFNVCDRATALKEAARILRTNAWFACMWNHRELDNSIQSNIETIISERIENYRYGSRREDQTSVIEESGLFGPVVRLEASVKYEQSIHECIEAWRSHATLQRQAGTSFDEIIVAISNYLLSLGQASIVVPYTTRVWVARRR